MMFNNISEFYPTPAVLIDLMLKDINFKKIKTILEPSAGKGNIVESIKNIENNIHIRKSFNIDCIEANKELQHILKAKSFRVVHNDFLTFHSYKSYDLIVMNPPFSDGDKHLLKAIKMQEKGGQIVCILNAETLKNPYSNSRKELAMYLDEYNSTVEYFSNMFINAERKTPVEIALIKIKIPKLSNDDSVILDDLKKQKRLKPQEDLNNYALISNDFILGIVEQYNFEARTGLKLIAEYKALKPYILKKFKEECETPILELSISNNDTKSSMENGFIEQLRMKYWNALFMSEQFIGMFTSNLKQEYVSNIYKLIDYDFSLYNIYTIRAELSKKTIKSVEETIIELFDDLSHKYHYYNETSKNIHFYNGWKTNKSYKINKKVIIPLNAYCNFFDRYEPSYSNVINKLSDIEKVFNYLDQGLTKSVDLKSALENAKEHSITKKIDSKYFVITFYKKGTCHLTFKNLELLHKFNLFGSQRKNWLPPAYGKVKYDEMTIDEQRIIDEFEGKQSYNKVMLYKEYYIANPAKMMAIAAN